MKYVDHELTIEEMLADPIVQTLMRYDGISATDVRQIINQVTDRPDSESYPALNTPTGIWATSTIRHSAA